MATPVSQDFKRALVAPIRDVTMRLNVWQPTALLSYAAANRPGAVLIWNGTSFTDSKNDTVATNSGVTANTSVSFCPASRFGYEFDGSSSYFYWTDATATSVSSKWSIGFWAERDGETADYVIAWPTGGVGVYFDATGYLHVEKVGTGDAFVSDDVFTDRLPHYYIVSHDGNRVYLYVDGWRVDGTSTSRTFSPNAGSVMVGRSQASGDYFDGIIDDIQVTQAYTNEQDAQAWWDAFFYNGEYKLVQEVDEVLEGIVYVDTDRATRRTCQVRLSNDDGLLVPENPDDLFWWDKVFSIDYGLRVGDDYEYIQTGMFMIDVTEVLAEKEASVINVDGTDLWKKFAKSDFALPQAYFTGTTYNAVITHFANAAGIFQLNLDPLSDRASTEKTLQAPLYFEIDDNRGDKLWELCEKWGIDIWFDVYGVLTTRDKLKRIDTLDATAPVWSFTTGEDAIFLSLTKRKSGDDIFNHVVVSGELDDGGIVVVAEAIDGLGTSVTGKKYLNDPNSPTRVELIGDRVKRIKSTELRTTAAAQIVADAELAQGSSVEEDIRLPSMVVPHLEGFDVIEIVEPTLTKTNDKYFLKRFDIPMRQGSQQEINVTKLRGIL